MNRKWKAATAILLALTMLCNPLTFFGESLTDSRVLAEESDTITVKKNQSGFIKFPEPVLPEGDIVTLNFTVTPNQNGDSENNLNMFIGFYGSNTTVTEDPELRNSDKMVPMMIQFRNSPKDVQFYHIQNSGTNNTNNTIMDSWEYGTTYNVTIKLNISTHKYQVIINGNASAERLLYNENTNGAAPLDTDRFEIRDIGAVAWRGTGDCGATTATVSGLPLTAAPKVASVSGVSVTPSALASSDGGDAVVTVTGANLDAADSVKVQVGEGSLLSAVVDGSDSTQATATVTLPANTTGSDADHAVKVYLNDVLVSGVNAMVTVPKATAADPNAITVTNNKTGFIKFPEPVLPEDNIVTLNFTVTPNQNGDSENNLNMYLGFYGSNTTVNGPQDLRSTNYDVPIMIQFRLQKDIQFFHIRNQEPYVENWNSEVAKWDYGTTYNIQIELNISTQKYRVIVNGTESAWRLLYNENTNGNAPAVPDKFALRDIAAVAWRGTGECGATTATVSGLPLTAAPKVASVSGVSVTPSAMASSDGGDAVVTVTGANLDVADSVKVQVGEGSLLSAIVDGSDSTKATATVTLPANATESDVDHVVKVYLDDILVPDMIATVTVPKQVVAASVTNVRVVPPVLPKEGGEYMVIVTGAGFVNGVTNIKTGIGSAESALTVLNSTTAVFASTHPNNADASDVVETLSVYLDDAVVSDVAADLTIAGASGNAVTAAYADGKVAYQITEPVTGNSAAVRRAVMAAFAAMQKGDTLAFHNNTITVVMKEDGTRLFEAWPTVEVEEIRTAMYGLMPGDTFYFHQGTYVRIPTLYGDAGGNNTLRSGTSGAPITIGGYPGEDRPVFNNTSGYNIWELALNYVDVSHMAFTGKGLGIRLDGVNDVVDNISVTDCVFDAVADTNLAANRAGLTISNITIENNSFINLKYTPVYFGTHGKYEEDSISSGTTGTGIVFRNNFIDGRDHDLNANYVGYGIEFKLDVVNSEISRNLIINTKGPGIMVYGAVNQGTAPNIVKDNLIVGSQTEAGINIGGGPSIAKNNISLGNIKYGIWIQNYGAANLNTNITIQGNTSGLTTSANVDYAVDANTDTTTNAGRNVLVSDNTFIQSSAAAPLLKRQADTIKEFREMPDTANAFFTALAGKGAALTEAQLIELLSSTLLQGKELVEADYGANAIKTAMNGSQFIKFPEPIKPIGGIATLKFKYTAESGALPLDSGLKLYMGIYGSNTAVDGTSIPNTDGGNHEKINLLPMELQFTRNTGTGHPSGVQMSYGNTAANLSAICGYGSTYDITVELNVNTQQYRVTIGTTSSAWRDLRTGTYEPLTDIGAISWEQWNGTGTTYAMLGDLPTVAQGPKDYGTDTIDLVKGGQEIVQLPRNITPVNGELRYKVRVSPQNVTVGASSYKLNIFLYQPTIDPNTLEWLESRLPMGVNFVTTNGANAIKFLTGAGNEGLVGGSSAWTFGEVYDVEFVVNVNAQKYKVIVYDSVGNIFTISDERDFFLPGDGVADYPTPVNSIGWVVFEQVNGSTRIGDVTANLPAEPAVVAPVITTTSVANGTVNAAYSATLAASGSPAAWTVESGALPTGLTLSAGGVISGTPRTSGTYNFTVKAENSQGSDTVALAITITGAGSVTPPTTPSDDSGNTTPSTPTPPTSTTPPTTGDTENGTEVGGIKVVTPDGSTPVANPDGSTSLPGGGEVTTSDGSVVTLPGGSIITDSGSIVVGPDGASYKTAGSDEEIIFPEGYEFVFDEDIPLGFITVGLPYVDVKPSDWYFEAVAFTVRSSLAGSLVASGTAFNPSEETTRAMVVSMLYELADSPAAVGGMFNDIAEGSSYDVPAGWAFENGIAYGSGSQLFNPDAAITRQDLAVMLVRYAQYAGYSLTAVRGGKTFADASSTSDYAKEAIDMLYRAGIINGKPGNCYDPKGVATKAEVAVMLAAFLQAVNK